MAKKMVKQACKLCKFCECHHVNITILVDEVENDDKDVAVMKGMDLHKQAWIFKKTKFAMHFEGYV